MQPRRHLGAAAVIAAALGLALGGWRLWAQRRVQTAAHEVHGALSEALAGERAALEREARQAATVGPLRAALANNIDPVTLDDLLETEDWWKKFRGRGRGTVIAARGRILATRGQAPAVSALALGRLRGSSFVTAADGRLIKAAVAAVAIPEIDALVLLAHAVDEAGAQALVGRVSASLLLSDGKAPGACLGPAATCAQMARLVGQETPGRAFDADAGWSAAAVSVGEGRWIWGLRAVGGGRAPPAAAIGAAWALAALLAWARARRARSREQEPAQPAARTSAETPAPEARLAPLPTLIASAGPRPFGRYTLLDRIGEGGMAEIFTALLTGAEGFQRVLVIKRLKPELAANKTAIDQFIDEAKLGSVLVHSNIVPVLDFGRVGANYFLAQEFIVGRNLSQVMERHEKHSGPLGPRLVLYVAHEVLEALAFAHDKTSDAGEPLGIVHRDISTSNIMVTAEGEVKLLDFGIVKAEGRVSTTEIGNVKGNPAFMSPEQARGQRTDARSDLFSLGVVIYGAVTGQPFYVGENSAEVFYQAITGPTAEHWARIRALPAPAAQILERALAMDPASRFPNARSFADAVAGFVIGAKPELAAIMKTLFGDELRRPTLPPQQEATASQRRS